MTDFKDGDVSGSRASTAFTTFSAQSLGDDDRSTSAELPSPSPSRMSEYSDVSTLSFRTFYPVAGYPTDVFEPGYPDNGYPDTGYPTETLYPSENFPVVKYPQTEVPPSPYPATPIPDSSYPSTPTSTNSLPDYPGTDVTSFVLSEDLGLSRDSSEVMHPMSAFMDSTSTETEKAETCRADGYHRQGPT